MFEDFCTREGAHALAGQIRDYWWARGRFGIQTEVVHIAQSDHDRLSKNAVYGVRSNIDETGYPPTDLFRL